MRDPQWHRTVVRPSLPAPVGWRIFRENPWPGLTLLVDVKAGGYREKAGFTGNPRHRPTPIPNEPVPAAESEGHDEDPLSGVGFPTSLPAHLGHVAAEAESLCRALEVPATDRGAVIRAGRWHDLGKAHEVFQRTMRAGLVDGMKIPETVLLAKTVSGSVRHDRAYFRHELASALAFLAHESWRRDADLGAYLIAAHHGKVRMNLRALPREKPPAFAGDAAAPRFARGVREGEELPPVDLGAGEHWPGGALKLSVMELGLDEETGASWTERTRDLLATEGPFRLAWLETLVRIADWRASRKEREGAYEDA